MKPNYDPEGIAFAEEARNFIRSNLDPKMRIKVLSGQIPTREERTIWQKLLVSKGWGAPAWPVEYGGTGWSVIKRHIFDEVLSEEGAPGFPVFGMTMLAPVLMQFGTEKQKKEYLKPILEMENVWCQGFSEPEAGSDLASIKMKARLENNEWIINGQKTWTTLAHEADKIFLLARTSDAPKRQMGVSILLADMNTPGITVRPIITIEGHHEVNEVFFDDVRIPAENIIGEEGKGWGYAKFLLGHERTSIARIGQSKRELTRLRNAAAKVSWQDKTLMQAPWFLRRLAEIETRHRVLAETTLRLLATIAAGGKSGSEANLLKIHGTEIQQALTELWMEVTGIYGFAYGQFEASAGENLAEVASWEADYVAGAFFNNRKLSIYGGSNEIQRNIIAKHTLGL